MCKRLGSRQGERRSTSPLGKALQSGERRKWAACAGAPTPEPVVLPAWESPEPGEAGSMPLSRAARIEAEILRVQQVRRPRVGGEASIRQRPAALTRCSVRT
jgi:hypothetical protein